MDLSSPSHSSTSLVLPSLGQEADKPYSDESDLRGFTSSSSKPTSNLTFSNCQNSVLSHWHQKSPLQTGCLQKIELLQCSRYQAFKFSFISFSERLSQTQVIQFSIEPLVGYFWSAEITFQRPWPFAINCFSQGLLITHSVQCDGFCCFFGINVFIQLR